MVTGMADETTTSRSLSTSDEWVLLFSEKEPAKKEPGEVQYHSSHGYRHHRGDYRNQIDKLLAVVPAESPMGSTWMS